MYRIGLKVPFAVTGHIYFFFLVGHQKPNAVQAIRGKEQPKINVSGTDEHIALNSCSEPRLVIQTTVQVKLCQDSCLAFSLASRPIVRGISWP